MLSVISKSYLNQRTNEYEAGIFITPQPTGVLETITFPYQEYGKNKSHQICNILYAVKSFRQFALETSIMQIDEINGLVTYLTNNNYTVTFNIESITLHNHKLLCMAKLNS